MQRVESLIKVALRAGAYGVTVSLSFMGVLNRRTQQSADPRRERYRNRDRGGNRHCHGSSYQPADVDFEHLGFITAQHSEHVAYPAKHDHYGAGDW